jgi:ADP-ribose pyrophosphatase YjhB (NUDIX family)
VLRPLTDALFRLAYRCAFRLMRISWRFRRPHHDGAVVAVRLGDAVLMVRHSYRDVLGWPGGGIGRGETAREAARRELREELGLAVAPEALKSVGELVGYWEFRRDHVRIFELTLHEPPVLRLDNREVIAATFMERHEILAARVATFVRAYLEDRLSPPLEP